jgi:dihydrofolate reductase
MPHCVPPRSISSSAADYTADALLLGRVTHEGFASAWPGRPSAPYTDRINALPKHVASRTPQALEWNGTVIEGDVVEGVDTTHLQLDRTTTFASGIVVHVYAGTAA